ncbi:DUF4282 domain-containing protein [Maricaulis sp.]|uniref:DUF4282 domain-containing protein n=1 Tax=Maricaulis sp. TaxID=1486257 RepID=UPI003A92927A|tara:strand:- start:870 stop:1154 length:285 start_codon:yes stop_codon:yes gene_type:complete
MNDLIKRFTTFDKLIATSLIKFLYWIGLAGIALSVIVGIFGAIGAMTQSFLAGLGMLIAVPLGGVIGLVFWRFICEIYIVIFGIYDRLGEIRDK